MAEAPLFLLAGGLMIGVLVIVHEAGHYVVARLFGVGTPVFSIGMGPRIFGFRFWETDFRISLLPIGGYVRMAGADAFGEEDADGWENPDEDFMSKPVWQRLLIMLAGPAANLILPFILYTGVYMFGYPVPDAVVGRVVPGGAADEAGIEEGDRFVAVGDEPVENWLEYQRRMVEQAGGAVSVTIQRGGAESTHTLPAGVVPADRAQLANAIGLTNSRLSSQIGVSDTSSPAYMAGLRTGDLVVEVDGAEVESFRELQAALVPGRPHELELERLVDVDGEEKPVQETVELTLSPDPSWSPAAAEVVPDPWGLVPVEVFVAFVQEDSAAEGAGVLPGDRITKIDGQVVRAWEDIVRYVRATANDLALEQVAVQSRGCMAEEPTVYGRALTLEIVRDGTPRELEFRPQVQRVVHGADVSYRPIMGVRPYSFSKVGPREMISTHYGVIEAVPLAIDEGIDVVSRTLDALGKLITGVLRPQEGLGGPVAIVRTAGMAAKAGVHWFLMTMGAISFSLGIINLLPVPVLDGGQILFYSIEGIRGRPVPLAIRERVQMVGVLFLAALMVMVVVNDIGQWLFPAG